MDTEALQFWADIIGQRSAASCHGSSQSEGLLLWLGVKVSKEGAKKAAFVPTLSAGLIPGQETKGLCGGSSRKESACNAGNPGSIPGLRRSSGEGNGSPFQYSCLENSIDRGT